SPRPWRPDRVHVEPGAQAEIPAVALAGNAQAARAGIRDHDGKAELRGQALRARLDDEILLGAGQARKSVEDRHRARLGLRRKKHAEAHDRSRFARRMAMDALDAAETSAAGNVRDQ